MIVLLTNDDGYQAEGLRALTEAFTAAADFSPYVVAPDRERSATSHAITMHKPLIVNELCKEGCATWVVSGTPADCVKLAVEALLPKKPALVISGINRGANLGNDILYSGTVSAAIEGTLLSIPSVAISLCSRDSGDFSVAAAFGVRLARLVVANGLPPSTLLNVNVPGIPADRIRGVRVTCLGTRRYQNVFDRRVDPRGRVYYWMAGDACDEEESEDTDVAATLCGYISLTPVKIDLTAREFVEELKGWNLE